MSCTAKSCYAGGSRVTDTVGGAPFGGAASVVLITTTGIAPYGHAGNDATFSKVPRPMTIVSMPEIKAPYPQSSPTGTRALSASSQSKLPSRRAMKPSTLQEMKTEQRGRAIVELVRLGGSPCVPVVNPRTRRVGVGGGKAARAARRCACVAGDGAFCALRAAVKFPSQQQGG